MNSKAQAGVYLVPAARQRAEIEVKRSRFIASVGHAGNRFEANAFIASVRGEFADATHNAYALCAGSGGDAIACSDDGEVAGTAGRPMLQILQHSGLSEVVAVVSRYYGGTLLGSGGLQRAYGQALKAALAQLPTKPAQTLIGVELAFDFALEAGVRHLLHQHSALVQQQEYAALVSLRIVVAQFQIESLQAALLALCRGQLHWRVLD